MQFVPNFGRPVPAVAKVRVHLVVEDIYKSEVQFVPFIENVILHIAVEVIYYK